MNSPSPKKPPKAYASALGGYIEEQAKRVIAPLADVTLAAKNDISYVASGAFSDKEVISCSGAYSRIAWRDCTHGPDQTLLITSVVEDLNILEVVRADRIVTQLSIKILLDCSIEFSAAGTAYEGLRILGQDCELRFNEALHNPRDAKGARQGATLGTATAVGSEQGKTLSSFDSSRKGAIAWLTQDHAASVGAPAASGGGPVLASLVEGVHASHHHRGFRSHGHIVDIPEFGRFIFGELSVCRGSVQLFGITADLTGDCHPIQCKIYVGGNTGQGGG